MSRLTVAVALVLVACGGDTVAPSPPPSPPPPPNAVGSYNLITINAVRLPVVVTLEGVSVTITSSVMNIRSGNTFSFNISAHDTATGIGVTIGSTGTWSQTGSNLTLHYDGGGCSDLAVIEERQLRIARDCEYGYEMVFQR
ncbi:MAG: hypothetical protein OXN92_01255 [Gammaproteobacteria bacterium]|nr:hypothetical protein [Gammaproteobacteria bacterium]MDE0356357.1 hypothetical protein [Gammaproteobacteria bacterium]MDE2944659.1 hypothetical protein [Gemmatimonadota bacterium]